MTTYETLILADPTLDREAIDGLMTKVSGQIEKTGGVLKNIDDWGVRRLAYQVKKFNEGLYLLYEFQADGTQTVRPFEDFLRLQAPVIRFKTTVKPDIQGERQNADHPSFRERR